MPTSISARITLVLFAIPFLSVSRAQTLHNSNGIEFAVLADVHFQDVYGMLSDSDYKGILVEESGEYAHIRSMASQLQSTRIFNENYFAFRAALDDIVQRGIKIVIMPGDFSDDGQPLHIRGFHRVLDEYTQEQGLSFFLITGNHDVVHPYPHPDGKVDFLAPDGQELAIVSDSAQMPKKLQIKNTPVISADLQNLGYAEIAEQLSDFGFYPNSKYHYWGTPFSSYAYPEYTYNKAKLEADLSMRSTVQAPNENPLPDLSYVVEPVEGVWFLALDANTYLAAENNPKTSKPSFRNTGKGLDNLPRHKSYLMDWVAQVVKEAEKNNKTLIAFSHYPMLDFNDGASAIIDSLLIGPKMQLNRIPDPEMGKRFADLGLKLHLGGHMHLNDTGILTTNKGNTLINIQTPSLAAYPAAYKALRVNSPEHIAVRTVPVSKVPRYAEFFDAYSKEYEKLEALKKPQIWNRDVLQATGYSDLMDWHLRELVRLRFLPSEWPASFISVFVKLTGSDLLNLTQLPNSTKVDEWLSHKSEASRSATGHKAASLSLNDTVGEASNWKWTGMDLLQDLYRLRSADALAFPDIGEARWAQYQELIDAFVERQNQTGSMHPFQQQIANTLKLLHALMLGEPAVDFEINLSSGSLYPLPDSIISDK